MAFAHLLSLPHVLSRASSSMEGSARACLAVILRLGLGLASGSAREQARLGLEKDRWTDQWSGVGSRWLSTTGGGNHQRLKKGVMSKRLGWGRSATKQRRSVAPPDCKALSEVLLLAMRRAIRSASASEAGLSAVSLRRADFEETGRAATESRFDRTTVHWLTDCPSVCGGKSGRNRDRTGRATLEARLA